MNIYLATDHAGFDHKEQLKVFLELENQKGHLYKVIDVGAIEYNNEDDYNSYIHNAMKLLKRDWDMGLGSRAIIFGGSGEGEAMTANRYSGVRATVYYGYDIDIIKLGREHNDANVLSLGARFINIDDMKEAVTTFFETPFSNAERHVRRISKIDIH